MPGVKNKYVASPDLRLGTTLNSRVPAADQSRQRAEVDEILHRLSSQPGIILADEVGMGKTFVALAIAHSVALTNRRGPVIIMVPSILIEKWEQDLQTFCDLYLVNQQPVRQETADKNTLRDDSKLRYGIARHSVELMKLLDDRPSERCQLIFLERGAMSRRQTDKWIRLALIAEALRVHGRGRASRLIQVKNQIHRFLGELLNAIGEQTAHGWGEELWKTLLRTAPEYWKDEYNREVKNAKYQLPDDPVPKSVVRALRRIDLKELSTELEKMPVRARGGEDRLTERLVATRKALRDVEEDLWKTLLAEARWRSPLLIMDEAHHLKNPGTALARQLQSADAEVDLRTGDGAMAQAFDRMLFLTATPFQLGHAELVRVLERFGDVCWDAESLGSREEFLHQLADLEATLNENQRAMIKLQKCWSRLGTADLAPEQDLDTWWRELRQAPESDRNLRQSAVLDAYELAKNSQDATQGLLRRWIVRHNKGALWADTQISRRLRRDGAAIINQDATGIPVPPRQLLPFFLAARSAVNPRKDLLGEALCSSYEAFRFTRLDRIAKKDDELDEEDEQPQDLAHARWYLSEFDAALVNEQGSQHPKIAATVRKVVDLWEMGEKVLVFGFYRHTCRALRLHISQEIERRMAEIGAARCGFGNESAAQVEKVLERIQDRFFDRPDSAGRQSLDQALRKIVEPRSQRLESLGLDTETLCEVMRRFLRVGTTMIRCFPLEVVDSIDPSDAVGGMLDRQDAAGHSWRTKFDAFLETIADRCEGAERSAILDAALRTQTGSIREQVEEDEKTEGFGSQLALANVRIATGRTDRETRTRLMRAFNTPFFPDILVCSQVMGEGVDLQRFCQHVIHHDLDWNPSTIEQRTGRIDRLGCKAEGRHPILDYRPYLAGAADERQFKVMSDREQWFRIVMGQEQVASLITPESQPLIPLPEEISRELSFDLSVRTDGRGTSFLAHAGYGANDSSSF